MLLLLQVRAAAVHQPPLGVEQLRRPHRLPPFNHAALPLPCSLAAR